MTTHAINTRARQSNPTAIVKGRIRCDKNDFTDFRTLIRTLENVSESCSIKLSILHTLS